MLVNVFCSSILLVVSWLTYQIHDNNRSLVQLESQLQDITIVLSQSLKEDISAVSVVSKSSSEAIITQLDSYIEEQKALETELSGMEDSLKFAKAELSAKSTKLDNAEKRRLLEQALSTVLQAEVFNRFQNSSAASSTLLSSKDAIWKSSGNFPKSSDKLKKLMGPIDSLAKKWERGEFTESSLSIRKTIKEVLDTSG